MFVQEQVTMIDQSMCLVGDNNTGQLAMPTVEICRETVNYI